MFSHSQNLLIAGGTFVNTSTSTLKGFDILHRNIASDAFHNSSKRFDPPRCHPNTRVAVLEEIMRWIRAIEESEDILWLYGSAGAGKSAIAQTIAEMCAKLGLLVASFFFSRAFQSRNNDKRLISSIAYQLALSIPPTRPYIDSAVQRDPAIFDRSLDTQIQTLIIGPLENALADVNVADAKQWPRLIIVDGLDECDGPSNQCSIIRVLSAALRLVPVPLVLFVASRPEPHIRNTFNRLLKSGSHISRHIVLNDSYKPDADIKEFLSSRFKEIKENHQLSAYISDSWPSEEIFDQLVLKSSGQFIYASTVMKYLDSPKHRPVQRLDVIMGLKSVVGDMPYKELDALYSHIFSCIEDIGTTLTILGFLFFGYRSVFRFTPDHLACLLELDPEDICLHLAELHSILYIPPPRNASGMTQIPDFAREIRPTHASLQDFLVDKLRSGKYYLDEEAFHTNLAQKGIRHIRSLSTKQSLNASSVLERYLKYSFIYHCAHASTDSAELKSDLMQLSDLRPLFGKIRCHGMPDLFKWLFKADTVAKELSNHIQSLCDQYLITELSKYSFDGSNVDIVWFLFFTAEDPVLPCPRFFRWATMSVPGSIPYQHFLCEFFEDKTRSGKYHVDGTAYAHVVLEFLRITIDSGDIFDNYSVTGRLPMTWQRKITVGYRERLEAVITLLSKAAPLTDLYLYLRDDPLQNPAEAEVHSEDGLASVRLAVKAYLEKCIHLVPKASSKTVGKLSRLFKFSKMLGKG